MSEGDQIREMFSPSGLIDVSLERIKVGALTEIAAQLLEIKEVLMSTSSRQVSEVSDPFFPTKLENRHPRVSGHESTLDIDELLQDLESLIGRSRGKKEIVTP